MEWFSVSDFHGRLSQYLTNIPTPDRGAIKPVPYCKTLTFGWALLFGAIASKNKNRQNMRPRNKSRIELQNM